MGAPAHKRTVVVNDDRTQLSLLTSILKTEGYDSKSFISAKAALAYLCASAPPDLIVTDLHMPEMDGWRFCRLLRTPEYAAFNSVPVLVVSATFSGVDVDEVTMGGGANAFLSVPLDIGEFKETVRKLAACELPIQATSVLVVDDDEALTEVLGRVFLKNGYKSVVAHSKREALERVAESHPSLALVDHHLPDGKGSELVEELCAVSPATAVIMMTADPDPRLAAEWLRKGARAYLPKPFDHDYLLALAHKAYRESSLMRIETVLEKRTMELRESEHKFRMIAEFSYDWEYWVDADLNMMYCSPACERLTGYKASEFMNDRQLLEQIVHPGDRVAYRKHVELYGVGGKCEEFTEFDFRIIRKDCGLSWLGHACCPIYDPKGRYLGRRISNRDVTGRK